MSIKDTLFALLKCSLNEKKLDEELILSLDEKTLTTIYEVSRFHDVTHIISSLLLENTVLQKDSVLESKFESEVGRAIKRAEMLDVELENIHRVLDAEKIPYVELKGTAFRKYYPKPIMRTSCDIDILVKEQDLKRAISALKSCLGYESNEKLNYHDVVLRSKSGVNLELHYNTTVEIEKADSLLILAWDYATPIREEKSEHILSNEFIMLYLTAHTASHFVHGGCGIKPFMDFFVLGKSLCVNKEKLDSLLISAGLKTFYDEAIKISAVWFGEDGDSNYNVEMQKYILSGGAYGTSQNRIVATQSRKGGKFKHILSRIFLPYRDLSVEYPVVKKYKILVPVFQVVRWFRMIFKGRLKKSVSELKGTVSVTSESAAKIKVLFDSLELGGI